MIVVVRVVAGVWVVSIIFHNLLFDGQDHREL